MGDFFLDFRPKEKRACKQAGAFLRFFPDMTVDTFDYPEFGLVVTSSDDQRLWGHFVSPDGALLVALCGRVSLEQTEWNVGQNVSGTGGLACKFISDLYHKRGIAGVESLSGNFAILVFDRARKKFFVVTDRWGLFPAFRFAHGSALAFGSHADSLADAVGESNNWDETSFAEFILTCRLMAPNTYYAKIKALSMASTVTIDCAGEGFREEARQYFQIAHQPWGDNKVEVLAEEFAAAFKKAVTKRTLPLLGRSAVALSGGLDSRTVLCSAANREDLVTFTCYDEENREFRIAREIAEAVGAKFIPLKRPFDYYGENAALGIKISGAMGCIASNHFLGFRSQLNELGIDNLLTGCYCDYVYKGLAVNKRYARWTEHESVGTFKFNYYGPHYPSDTPLARSLQQRLDQIFPAELRRYDSEQRVLQVEKIRMFPLSYEEDLAERTIPQRVMGWCPPIGENDLMDVHLKMSGAMRLNRDLFVQMVKKVCGPEVCAISDANTGAPVNASAMRETFSNQWCKVEGLLRRLKGSKTTSGSWPNWKVYANQSPTIRQLWSRPNPQADDLFTRVLGNRYKKQIGEYEDVYQFLQLFTLKVWLDQRDGEKNS
jgi:asparagine synthase (glutamine-hydrolysing)